MNFLSFIRTFFFGSDNVQEKHLKFYQITQGAYLFGLIGHTMAIFMFKSLGVKEMVIFNALVSVPAFAIALFLNKKGWHNLGFLFAFLELFLHQVLTTYYVGWNFGAHYWLIYLAGLSFFNSQWRLKTHLFLLAIVISGYMALFFFCQEGLYSFDQKTQNNFLLNNAITVFIVLSLLIYYFSTTTFKAEQKLKAEQALTASMLEKIRWLFGQQVSKEVATQMIASENEIESRSFDATVMFLDIRDFTVFADSRDPMEVAKFQNIVFGALIDIVRIHKGVILQLLGDGLMAVFGAPVEDPNHQQHAVNASFDMLQKIEDLATNGSIPKIRVGIGLHAGNILAGNLGSDVRKFYSLTGKNVIVAARIEPLNKQFKSQFLISDTVYEAIQKDNLEIEHLGAIPLKGIENPVNIYKLR